MDRPRTAVIGIGNEYRGDDGAGIAVARALIDMPGVDVLELPGEGTEIIELMASYDRIMLIDASQPNSFPGQTTMFDVAREAPPVRFFSYSTHAFGLSEAVEVARALGLLPQCLLVYAIEGEDFQAGSNLSPAVKKAVHEIAQQIRQQLAED